LSCSFYTNYSCCKAKTNVTNLLYMTLAMYLLNSFSLQKLHFLSRWITPLFSHFVSLLNFLPIQRHSWLQLNLPFSLSLNSIFFFSFFALHSLFLSLSLSFFLSLCLSLSLPLSLAFSLTFNLSPFLSLTLYLSPTLSLMLSSLSRFCISFHSYFLLSVFAFLSLLLIYL
jgi:hypothetical protein